jgi:alkanesulfonate monooxygenase SsuD/methylene tetrahydromethanopterin reductase-like flavin-dependent oxidoreductase (luciferase family)
LSSPGTAPPAAGRHIGFLNRLYAPGFDPSVLEDALRLISAAEELGLGSAWVAQHHFGWESGCLPSPLVLLAAAAQRTSRIQLGTAVVVLPLESPVRLAEDVSVTDALSGARLQLGLGTGFDRQTFDAFGEPFAGRHAAYDSKLARLSAWLAGGPLADSEGDDGKPPPGNVPAILQPPAPELRTRLWEAGGRVEAIAARGNGFLAAPRSPELESEQSLIQRYRAQWRTSGHAAAPRIAVVRGVFAGRDRRQVENEIGPDIKTHVERLGGRFDATDLPMQLRRLGVLWGSPQQIIDDIGEGSILSGVSHFIAQVQTLTTSHQTALHRLRLFCEQIAPALA